MRREQDKFLKTNKLIKRVMFRHGQNYLFQLHCFKNSLVSEELRGLSCYLSAMADRSIEIDCENLLNRPSKLGPQQLDIPCRNLDHSHASELAGLALKACRTNYQRHRVLQRFFLAVDLTTLAVEVPIFMTPSETERILGITGGILGHIDLVQSHGSAVFVQDYKPNASKEKHAAVQLSFYALALSLRTGIHLRKIFCSWFDEKNHYVFRAIDGYRQLRKCLLLSDDRIIDWRGHSLLPSLGQLERRHQL